MNAAEWILLIVILYGLYRILGPVQKRLEGAFYRIFRKSSRHPEKPVINITDYKKDNERE